MMIEVLQEGLNIDVFNIFNLYESINYVNKIFDVSLKYEKDDIFSIPLLEKLVLIEELNSFSKTTPIYKIRLKNSNTLYLKDEGNYGFSVKMRSVLGLFISGVIAGQIKYNTTIVESSSGNTAIAEAFIVNKLLKRYNIKFKAIVDSRIVSNDEKCKGKRIMRLADDVEIIPISKEDPSAVNDRLKRVNELKKLNNYYVPDQYDNPYAVFGTYFYLAREIDEQLRRMGISWINLDYIVNSISTGAHSIGIGLFAKQRNKNVRIIGVE